MNLGQVTAISYGFVKPGSGKTDVFLYNLIVWNLTLWMMGGIHAGVLFLGSTLGLLVSWQHLDPHQGLVYFISSVMIFASLSSIDFRSAALLLDVGEQNLVHQQLLDRASDGFCSVDPVTGIILEASPRFMDTFGHPILEEATLADIIVGSNDWGTTRTSLQNNEALLVTCYLRASASSGGSLFDAKIMPLSSSSDSLSICVQVVGEGRAPDVLHVEPPLLKSNVSNVPDADVCSFGSLSLSESRPFWGSSVTLRKVPVALQTERQIQTWDRDSQTSDPRRGLRRRHPLPPLPPGHLMRSWSRGKSEGRQSRSPQQGSTRSRKRASGRSASPVVGGLSRSAEVKSSRTIDDDGPALLSPFAVTAANSRRATLMMLVEHWNVPRLPEMCCPWHTIDLILQSEAEALLSRTPCSAVWSPLASWQCASCQVMNSADDEYCTLCSEPQGHLSPPDVQSLPQKGGSSGSGGDTASVLEPVSDLLSL
mmetsp:Transcript_71421/g.155121  ORF Transcript_71421/g.155121 Transcript_71421/m.155121 type:complete len:481 (+) Transcript_71421:438-1880(+)